MKRVVFSTTILLTIILTTASCTKCKICSKPGENEVRICEKDYNSQTAYGIEVDMYESQGYDCIESY